MFKKVILAASIICSGLMLLADKADICSITPGEGEAMKLKNSLVELDLSGKIGSRQGITSWKFLSTGQDMIDRNRALKNILGEHWDSIAFKQLPAGMPFSHGDIYAPVARGASNDGSAVGIIQESKKKYRLRRTVVMRRDYSVLNISWELENISGKAVGGAFRFFTACFPGALTGTTLKSTSVFMPTEKGVLELDQNLHSSKYKEIHGDTKFFQRRWDNGKEPLRWWVRRKLKTPFAKGYWTCEVNRNNGNGILFIGDPKTLIGYYNDPRQTLEMVVEAVGLQPGEKWQTSARVGVFAVPKGMKVSNINALFVSCGKNGIVPLFKGNCEINGKKYPADPAKMIKINSTAVKNLKAFDTKGKLLGSFENGACKLSPDEIKYIIPEKPWFWGKVYNPDRSKIAEFLKKRDFTVYCGPNNRRDVKKAASEIAILLGVGLASTKPDGKILAIGAAEDDNLVQNIGLMNNSVNDKWPGKGQGALRYFQKLGISNAAAVIVAGSDVKGTLRALDKFKGQQLEDVKTPQGYTLSVEPVNFKIYPYSRPGTEAGKKIVIECAKGEYESAQLMLTALSTQKNIHVTVSDLVNVKTGKKLSKKFITYWRKKNGPVKVRWVGNFPFEPKPGQKIFPDPLFERSVSMVPAGESQGIWLTFIMPETADAGKYRATLTCKASGGTKKIPIEVNIWDFKIPRKGLMGRAYAHMQTLAQRGKILRDHELDIYVRDMVEHGMRFINLTALKMFQWRFSKEGKFKDLKLPWQEVSKDGKLMLDASYFDEVKERCDRIGKPFKLIYMVYLYHTLYFDSGKFRQVFPKRYKKRPGHPIINSRYTEEMLTLLRKHLEKRGWLKDIYVKVSDEPGNMHKWYNELCQAVVGSGLQFFTAHGSSDMSDATAKMSDVWMPIYGSYDDKIMKKFRKAGKLISFYNCGPPPTTAVGAPASEWRSYLWQASKYDLDIVCWWGIQCWSYYDGNEALWRNYYSHWNSVIYPEHPVKKAFYVRNGKNRGWKDRGMIDSIRWETIRDGMEDAWYVNKLRVLIAEARKAGKKKAAEESEKVLDNIWKNTYPNKLRYCPPFKDIIKNRRAVAMEILKLKKILNKK